MSGYTKFYMRPGENELIETTVSLRPDARSAVHGVVKDIKGKVIASALAVLFEIGESDVSKLVSEVFTDDLGEFMFGPLTTGQLYMIKVYKSMYRPRQLEIRMEDDICE